MSSRLAIEDEPMDIDTFTEEFEQQLTIFTPNVSDQITIDFYDGDLDNYQAPPPADTPDGELRRAAFMNSVEQLRNNPQTRGRRQQRCMNVFTNDILTELMTYMKSCFDACEGDPPKDQVYAACCQWLNRRFPDITKESIGRVLHEIERKIRVALRAESKVSNKIRELKRGLEETFKAWVNTESEDILKMDIHELKLMQKALESLTKLVEKQMSIWGFDHRSLIIAKLIFSMKPVEEGEYDLPLQAVVERDV
jgi:hypothetical protein